MVFISLFLTACGIESNGSEQQRVSGSATLSWDPPTTNVDETPLTGLAGYKIYYGTTPGEYPEVIDINDPNTTEYTIENLPSGIYYFAVTAYDMSLNESDYSNEVSKTIL